MRLQSLIHSIFSSASSSTLRSSDTEFQRLSSFESSQNGGESFSRYEAEHNPSGKIAPGPSSQSLIELKVLNTSAVGTNGRNSEKNAIAQSSNQENKQGRDNAGFNQPDDEFRVYNPTSEELPETDEASPFALSDVRLAIQDIVVGNQNRNPGATESRGKDSLCCGRCAKICCASALTSRSSKDRAIALAIILVTFVILLSVMIIRQYSLQHYNRLENSSSREWHMLTRLEWPLHDANSRKLNISFNTMALDHSTWDKDRIGKGRYNVETTKDRHHQKEHPRMNGHEIDNEILKEVYQTAKENLKRKLNTNSSKLEILLWKGVAVTLVKEKLQERLNETSTLLEGDLRYDFCDTDFEFDRKCNKTAWYRSTNGSCNNVITKNWGSALSPLRHIEDHAQLVTDKIIFNNDHNFLGTSRPDPKASLLLPLWGMLIQHDTVKLPNYPVKCCSENSEVHRKNQSSKSCAIHSSVDDQLKRNSPEHCSTLFDRPAIYPSCKLEDHETSFNLATSFIDASNIYGSHQEITDKLRTKSFGQLKVQKLLHYKRSGFIPFNESCPTGNATQGNATDCNLTGDPDVYQVAHLTALHTVLLRQHNLIAHHLRHHNQHWDDERLFQESRSILIAQIQHITFNEFLPQILGKDMMNITGLQLMKDEFYARFDPEVDPSVSTAFAGAVAHFWYSMSTGSVKMVWRKGKFTESESLSIGELILKKDFLLRHRGTLEALIRGSSITNSNMVGLNFPAELLSLNLGVEKVNLVNQIVNRGRDLRLAPYIEWRKTCGLKEINSFPGIKEYWTEDAYSNITDIYKNLEEVDLFIGMLAEKPLPSARVGPTLACLLADQFLRFKMGDRYWYEGNVYFHHFSEEQLYTIRHTTSLARIICDNTNIDFVEIPKWPMLVESQTNPLESCSRIPVFDFYHWQENMKKENSLHVLVRSHGQPQVEDDITDGDWSLDYYLNGIEKFPDIVHTSHSTPTHKNTTKG